MKRLKRVAVIGMGAITPQGNGVEELLNNRAALPGGSIFEGNEKIGYSRISSPDTGKHLPGISLRCVDNITIYSGIASSMAIGSHFADAGIGPEKVGLALGSALGSIVSISNFDVKALTDGPLSVNPMEFPNTVTNAPASKVGIWFKLKGPSITISNALTSSTDAVGYAFDELSYGRAQYYLAGGSEEISEKIYRGYHSAADNGSAAREILGEGSGMVLLSVLDENTEKPLGEICDYFTSKIPADGSYAETVSYILSSMIDANGLFPGDIKLFSSYLPYNEYSGPVCEAAAKYFGPERMVIKNRTGEASVNYLGFNGVINLITALEEIKEDPHIKAALVFDIGCDGRFSCIMVRK